MTQKTIKFFVRENYSKPPKKNYSTNKTDVYFFDSIWSLDILDLKDYSSESNRGYRYVLVVIHNFNKYGWTILLKIKNAVTITNCFENKTISAKENQIYLKLIKETDFITGFFKIA